MKSSFLLTLLVAVLSAVSNSGKEVVRVCSKTLSDVDAVMLISTGSTSKDNNFYWFVVASLWNYILRLKKKSSSYLSHVLTFSIVFNCW